MQRLKPSIPTVLLYATFFIFNGNDYLSAQSLDTNVSLTKDFCQCKADSLTAALNSYNQFFSGPDGYIGGGAAAVLHKNKIIYLGTWGEADLEHKVPVTKNTKFQIASVTKAFTGLALLKLYETGKIKLDVPVQQFVPEFPKKNKETITPELLASHLAGIRHYKEDERTPEFFSTHYDNVVNALTLFKDDSLITKPGSTYNYSSYGYNLLAAAIQNSSGVMYQQFVDSIIFKQLGLKNTSFDDVRRVIPDRASSYTYWYPWFSYDQQSKIIRVPQFDYSYNMGGGNILSTVSDLVKFGNVFTEPGYLSAQTLDLVYKRIEDNSSWSYGWFVERDDSNRLKLRIEGSVPGFQANLIVYPEHNLVVALLLNSWGIRPPSSPPILNPPEWLAKKCMGWE